MVYKERYVRITANIIGVRKRIIAFRDESGKTPIYTVMLNLVILKNKPCDAENIKYMTKSSKITF